MAKQIGVITAVNGKVFAKSPDGKTRELDLNSPVYDTDIIIGNATIALDSGSIDVSGTTSLDSNVFAEVPVTRSEAAIQPQTTDTIIQALERGTDLNETLDATAAGLGAGGDGGGNSFVVLARILETVGRNLYGYNFNPLGIPEITEGVGEATSTTSNQPKDPGVPDVPEVPNPPSDPKEPETPEDPKDPDPEDPDEPQDPEDPPKDPEDPEEPEDPPVDDGKDNNGHGNNTDGQDDDNPGQGGGGPNSDPKDGDDEDEKDKGNDPLPEDPTEEEDPVDDEEEESEDPKPDEDPDEDEPEPEDEVEPDDGQDPGPSEPPKDGEDENDNPKEHQDNGKGNGVDDAPGGSGDTKGDDADGSNTEGTIDTDEEDVIPMPVDKPKGGNNGWGNGDQDAPGNSLDNNNAENSDATNPLDHRDLLQEGPGNSGGNPHFQDTSELLAGLNGTSLSDLLKGHGHSD